VAQKLYKKEYLAKLKKDLPQHSPTEEEEEEATEWNKILTTKLEKKQIEELTERALAGGDASDDDEEEGGPGHGDGQYILQKNGEMKFIKNKNIKNNFMFSFKIRKKHYQLKLERLDKLMNQAKDEEIEIDITRVNHTSLLHEKQKRLIEIQSEIDRVINFNGIEIISNILQNVEMTYLTSTLKTLLLNTSTQLLQDIASLKYQIILGENKKKNIKILLKNLLNEKKDRIAKLNNFLNEYEKQQRIMTNLVSGGGGSRYSLLTNYFQKLKKYILFLKSIKRNIKLAFLTCSRRFLKSAFEKWLTGKFSQEDDGDTTSGGVGGGSSGVGSRLLHKTRQLREEIQLTLQHELAQTFQIKKQLQMVSYSNQQKQKLMTSDYYSFMEDGGLNSIQMVIDDGMKFLYEGDGYVENRQYLQAERCYDAQIILLRSTSSLSSVTSTSRHTSGVGGTSGGTSGSSKSNSTIKYLAMCHGRLGKLYLRQEKYDRAIVEYDRQMSLGNEINDKIEIADSYYGLGTGYFYLLQYQNAISYLEIASSRYEILNSINKYCGCLYLLKECYQHLNKIDLINIYSQRIFEVENELKNKINLIYQKINKMTNQLKLNSAVFEFEIQIQRSSFRILELKKLLLQQNQDLISNQQTLVEQQAVCRGIEGLLEAIQNELNQSQITEEYEMMSYLIHDQPQLINIEELKTRLHSKRIDILKKYENEKNIELNLLTKIKNIEDEIGIHEDEILIEEGNLMKKIKNNRPYRVIAFNPANSASDEVTGTATGGVENFVCSESNNIHVIDYHNGELLHVYSGDIRSKIGEKQGHVGVITCLAYDMNRIYSGSTDETIMIWDHMSKQRVMVLTGHEGSIVSLAIHGFMLMSGGADATIRLWDKNNGRELRIIHGHSESVLSIDLGSNWMVTASSDEEVRVWEIKEKSRHTIKVDTKFRLQGHGTAVTVAKYGKLEVVSGDKKGDIIVWWVETGAIVQHIKGVHTGRVNCLQFDATSES
jgi:WD40 repeat protein